MNRIEYEMGKSERTWIELAAHIGKTEQTVKNYRDGVTQPPLDIAIKIAEFIGVPAVDLFDEVDADGILIHAQKAA